MVAFIDAHREAHGVEPICTQLPIAPATYYAHNASAADPTKRPARAQRDEMLCFDIQRVWTEHFKVYGPRKIWRQLKREGRVVARCTVERLMRRLACAGWCAAGCSGPRCRTGPPPGHPIWWTGTSPQRA